MTATTGKAPQTDGTGTAKPDMTDPNDQGISPDPIDDADPAPAPRRSGRRSGEDEIDEAGDEGGQKAQVLTENKRESLAKSFAKARKERIESGDDDEGGDAELRRKIAEGQQQIVTGNVRNPVEDETDGEGDQGAGDTGDAGTAKAGADDGDGGSAGQKKAGGQLDIVIFGKPVLVDRNDPRWFVDGATDEQIRAIAQQRLAADAYFERARHEASNPSGNQVDNSATASPHEPADQPGDRQSEAKSPDTPFDPTKLDTEKVSAIVDRIQSGIPEDGVEAVKDLLSLVMEAGGSRTDAKEIEAQVRRSFIQEQNQTEIDTAIRKFAKENSDLTTDKYLNQTLFAKAVDDMIADMKEIGVPDEFIKPIEGKPKQIAAVYRQLRVDGFSVRPYAEVLNGAGEHIRKVFNRPKSGKSTVVADPDKLNGRTQEKRTMQQQPRSAGARSQKPQGQRPPTPAEIVQREKERRMPWTKGANA